MKEFIINYWLYSYAIAFPFFILSLILEKKITVFDLFIALLYFAVPGVNVVIYIYNVIFLMNARNIISLQKIKENFQKFLNIRIK